MYSEINLFLFSAHSNIFLNSANLYRVNLGLKVTILMCECLPICCVSIVTVYIYHVNKLEARLLFDCLTQVLYLYCRLARAHSKFVTKSFDIA